MQPDDPGRRAGARMKLIGGDSGRYEHEELVDQVLLGPSAPGSSPWNRGARAATSPTGRTGRRLVTHPSNRDNDEDDSLEDDSCTGAVVGRGGWW